MAQPSRTPAVRKTQVAEAAGPRFLPVSADLVPPGMEAIAALVHVASGRAAAPSSGVNSTASERVCSAVLADVLTRLPKEGGPFQEKDGWLVVTLAVGTELPRASRKPIYDFLSDQLKRFGDEPLEEARILIASDTPFVLGLRVEWLSNAASTVQSEQYKYVLTIYKKLIDYSLMTRGARPDQQKNEKTAALPTLDVPGPAVERTQISDLEILRNGEEGCDAIHKAAAERFKRLLSDLEGFEGTSKQERQDVARRITRLAHRLGLVLMARDHSGGLVPVTLRCRGHKYEVRKSGGFPVASYDVFPPLAIDVRDELPNNSRD